MKKINLYEVDKKGYGELKNVEIVREGNFNGLKFTTKMFDKWIEKFNSQKADGFGLPVHIGHNQEGDDTKPAEGVITSLKRVGGSLKANIKGITSEFLNNIKKYPYRSIEATHPSSFSQELFSLALLGATTPAVRNEPIILKRDDKGEIIHGQKLANSFSHGADNIFLSNNISKMEKFKTLLEDIAKNKVITLADKAKLDGAFAMLSDEEQAEVQEDVDAVEVTEEVKKVEASDEEKTDEELAAEKKAEEAQKAAEAAVADAEVAKTELAQLKETSKGAIAQLQQKLSKMETSEKKRDYSEKVAKVSLSNKNLTGLNKEGAEKAVDLLVNLSEAQAKTVLDLISSVTTVSLAEVGENGDGVEKADGSDEGITKESTAAAEKLAAEKGITLGQAFKEIL